MDEGMRAWAYYNENDPFAAAWLRELIKAGHIAPGEVDARSIEDVVPTDVTGFTQCHFFAGIGGWSYAKCGEVEE
jgi:DNA (cytosine-5)-methyltransferase 1